MKPDVCQTCQRCRRQSHVVATARPYRRHGIPSQPQNYRNYTFSFRGFNQSVFLWSLQKGCVYTVLKVISPNNYFKICPKLFETPIAAAAAATATTTTITATTATAWHCHHHYHNQPRPQPLPTNTTTTTDQYHDHYRPIPQPLPTNTTTTIDHDHYRP